MQRSKAKAIMSHCQISPHNPVNTKLAWLFFMLETLGFVGVNIVQWIFFWAVKSARMLVKE